jgi:hypothetical protein
MPQRAAGNPVNHDCLDLADFIAAAVIRLVPFNLIAAVRPSVLSFFSVPGDAQRLRHESFRFLRFDNGTIGAPDFRSRS